MSQVKTELWHRIVGKFVSCGAESDESSFALTQLGDLLAVYAVALGADSTTVDLRKRKQADEALALLAERLHFPDYFGHNLDALYDVVTEYAEQFQVNLTERTSAVPQLWLIISTNEQAKMLFPIMDTLRDAMSQATGVGLSVLWLSVDGDA